MDKDEARRAYLRCMQANPCFFVTKCAKERAAYIESRAQWARRTRSETDEAWLDLLAAVL